MRKKILDILIYYTLEKPIIHVLYMAIGVIIIVCMLSQTEVPIYITVNGILSQNSREYVINIEKNTNSIEKVNNLYLYTNDMNYVWNVKNYIIDEEKIIIKDKNLKLRKNEKVRIRFEIGTQSLRDKLIKIP